jgi:hypothetical protein
MTLKHPENYETRMERMMTENIKEMFTLTEYDNATSNTAVFSITDGVFEGLEFTFGSVKVEEIEESGEAVLSFDYDVHNNDQYEFDLSEKSEIKKDLDNLVGDVLTYVITEQAMDESGTDAD